MKKIQVFILSLVIFNLNAENSETTDLTYDTLYNDMNILIDNSKKHFESIIQEMKALQAKIPQESAQAQENLKDDVSVLPKQKNNLSWGKRVKKSKQHTQKEIEADFEL